MTTTVGVDAVDVGRMRRMLELSPERFPAFAWTEAERLHCAGRADRFATRWAAKEAVMKVLGKGFAHLNPKDIEVVALDHERPTLRLRGRAADEAARQGIDSWSVSLTHEGSIAIAIVAGNGGTRND